MQDALCRNLTRQSFVKGMYTGPWTAISNFLSRLSLCLFHLFTIQSCIHPILYNILGPLTMGGNKEEKVIDVSTTGDLYPVETTGEPIAGHVDNADELQRHLGNRQLQLIAIGMYLLGYRKSRREQRWKSLRVLAGALHFANSEMFTDMSQVDPLEQQPSSPSPAVCSRAVPAPSSLPIPSTPACWDWSTTAKPK